MSTADEVSRLDLLRRSGALSQEEFEAIKAKLLVGAPPSPEFSLPGTGHAKPPQGGGLSQASEEVPQSPEFHPDYRTPSEPVSTSTEASAAHPPTPQAPATVGSDSSCRARSGPRRRNLLILLCAGIVAILVAVVILMLSLGGSTNSPASAATKWGVSFDRGHDEAFCSAFVPSQRAGCVLSWKGSPRTTKNFGIGLVKIEGDRALVVVTGSFCTVGDSCRSNADPNLGFDSGHSFLNLWVDATGVSSKSTLENTFIAPTQKEDGKWYITWPPFATGIPGSGGMSVAQLTSDVKAQITGPKPSGYHVVGVNSVTCSPPSTWTPKELFVCDAYASNGTWVGSYFGTVLPDNSSGDQQWNVTWSQAASNIVAMCKTAISVGLDVTAAQKNTLLPGAANDALTLNGEARAVGGPWLVLVNNLSNAGKTNRWAKVSAAISALDNACVGPASFSAKVHVPRTSASGATRSPTTTTLRPSTTTSTTTTTMPATTTTLRPPTTTTSTTTTTMPATTTTLRPTTTTTLVDVPGSIAGMSSTQATQELEAAGFRVGTTTAAQCPYAPGDVTTWSPYEPALPEGSLVTIEVCPSNPQEGGPGYTALPMVAVMQVGPATSTLEASGFRVSVDSANASVCDGGTFGSPGQVEDESPGTPYAVTGSTVTISVCPPANAG